MKIQNWRKLYFIILSLLFVILIITLVKSPDDKKLITKCITTIAVYIIAVWKIRKK